MGSGAVFVYYNDCKFIPCGRFYPLIYDIVALLAVTKFAKMAVNLEKAAEEMANGNINFKADVKSMKWRFKKHAQNLNSLNNGVLILP